jgi:adenine-specific DNA-methyltransferase
MQINAEDQGDRRFVLVQLPELIDEKKKKGAYDFVKNELKIAEPNLFEITRERLIRAAKKIKEEDKEAKDLDLGFKVFETTPIWNDYELQADELTNQVKLFDEKKLTDADLKALLITWKTNDGVALTEPAQAIDLGGYTGFYCKQNLYLMHKGFSTDNLKNLLEAIDTQKEFNPTSIIAFGYHFESKHLREIAEGVKAYANKKNIDIDFITRY